MLLFAAILIASIKSDSNCVSNTSVVLGSITDELKLEVGHRMMQSEFLMLLEGTILKHSNSTTADCIEMEQFFRRFTAQNTFSTIFKDLCNVILTYEEVQSNKIFDFFSFDETTIMKMVINNHLIEDGSHWELFYNDYKELGLNKMKKNKHSNDLLLYWFGDLTKGHRNTLYKIMRIDAKYDGDNDPIVRYIIILMVEETGKLMFAKFTQLYHIYMKKCDVFLDLQYVASSHSYVETGDLILTYEYKKYKKLFTQHIINDQARINQLYDIGRQVYNTVINITMMQNYHYLTNLYQKQDLWYL